MPKTSFANVAIAVSSLALCMTKPNAAYAKMGSGAGCASLAAIRIPDARVVSAASIVAGQFTPPPGAPSVPGLALRMARMPAFCRVEAVATPTPDSKINIEIWLPMGNWNGRFLGTGNGGSAGSIAYAMGMIEGLKRGFAVANTDMGTGPDINLLEQHPERWADFGHRSTHEMTRIAKAMVSAFYDVSSFRSYFEGCSTGGQQALVTAQRYPDDYDGILAGAPGNNRTHSSSYFLWNYQSVNANPASRMSSAQWSMVTQAAIAACAGKDGGAPGDRFLTDPRRCRFDPATLPVCKAGAPASDACLTGPQLAAVRRLHAGPVNPRTGERIYAGLTVGSEDQPLGPTRMNDPTILSRLFVMRWGMGQGFAPETFDFDRDLDQVDARLASTLNANDADLGEFRRRGGKLMLYTGLADAGVPFDDVVQYYDRVVSLSGREIGDFARLFLVPGMGHCAGGPGVTDIGQPLSANVPDDRQSDALMSLVAWTEGGAPPTQLMAHKPGGDGVPAQERPICAYPAFPDFRRGDPAKRSSYACTDHARDGIQVPAPRYLN